MREGDVIICYRAYHGQRPVLQGSFDTNHRDFPFSVRSGFHGHSLIFECETDGTNWQLAMQWVTTDGSMSALDVQLPVNKTKIKWREYVLDRELEVMVRAVLDTSAGVPRKPIRRRGVYIVGGLIQSKG